MPQAFVPSESNKHAESGHNSGGTPAASELNGPSETRVAATPTSVKKLIAMGYQVSVEAGAGNGAFISDQAYRDAGATIEPDRAKGLREADVVLTVNPAPSGVIEGMKAGASLVGFFWPVDRPELVARAAQRDVSIFAMDAIPRITRAQKHDALSSQTNLAGYKAVLLAAVHLPKIFPMLMTAAGTVRPAKVVIVGAGVAGLQAIATAKRLGAIVEVSDVRPEVKEQVESLGASYIEVKDAEVKSVGGYAGEQSEEAKRKQAEVLHRHLIDADVIITTALIPYRPAPKLVSAQVLREMRDGSVIVDLAAERGGNCELTEKGQIVVREGVTVIGTLNLPATLPSNASELYAKNIENVLADVTKKGELSWNLEDEVVAGALICHRGEVRHGPTRDAIAKAAAQRDETPTPVETVSQPANIVSPVATETPPPDPQPTADAAASLEGGVVENHHPASSNHQVEEKRADHNSDATETTNEATNDAWAENAVSEENQ